MSSNSNSNSNTYSYQSYSSTSYTSSSSTSSSTNNNNGQGTTKSYTEQMSSNDRDGTTYQRTTSETGKPTYIETTQVPANNSAGGGGRHHQLENSSQQGRTRIEDVTDSTAADQEYLERMEDEYAKREGGA